MAGGRVSSVPALGGSRPAATAPHLHGERHQRAAVPASLPSPGCTLSAGTVRSWECDGNTGPCPAGPGTVWALCRGRSRRIALGFSRLCPGLAEGPGLVHPPRWTSGPARPSPALPRRWRGPSAAAAPAGRGGGSGRGHGDALAGSAAVRRLGRGAAGPTPPRPGTAPSCELSRLCVRSTPRLCLHGCQRATTGLWVFLDSCFSSSIAPVCQERHKRPSGL